MASGQAATATQAAGGRPAGARLQRACASCAKAPVACPECARKKLLQRHGSGAGGPATFTGSPALTQGGAPLPPALRSRLGPLYGSDFAQVRLHDDADSHAASRAAEAHAFTVGQHVHFGAGQFRPHDAGGLRLLAHELGHTLQQQGAGVGGGELAVDAPGSPLEREADAAADAALHGRAARVRRGSAAGLQAKLLQREAGGIGTAAGGSDTATLDRTVDENTTVHIKRTVTERPCTSESVTRETASNKIFEWDRQAEALKLHYTICRGKVQLGTKGEVDYGKVVDSAKNLLDTLKNNPALGQDPSQLLEDRLKAATVTASGEISLTVDGILQASVQGSSTVGTAAQKYEVRGVLKVTPDGVSFTVTGGIDFNKTPLQSSTTYTLEGKVATQYFVVTLSYSQIDTSKVGGPPTSQGKSGFDLKVPVPDTPLTSGTSAGVCVSVVDGKPQVTACIGGRIGKPDKAPAVSCFECNCPPPLPEYSCVRDVAAHTRPFVKTPEQNTQVKLYYDYNSTRPQAPKDFDASVDSVATLLGQGYEVQHIWGYASPEGSLDAPQPPVPGFKGNQALSLSRAENARGRIAAKAPDAKLPGAEGKGEQLGDLDGSGDTADRDITPQLVALLEPKGDEERLDALGVDAAVRRDPRQREKVLADIRAFVEGRDARGLALAQRPRWEKVFPLLRRVEVALKKAAEIGQEPVAADMQPGCDDADIAYAKQNMPPLPPQRKLPPKACVDL